MVVTSDYEGLVAHYRELMNTYEIGTPGHSAYEYVVSMLSPSKTLLANATMNGIEAV